MLTALHRPHEFEGRCMAFRNGVTVAEVPEELLPTAVYVRAPAALESFPIAERVIRERDAHE